MTPTTQAKHAREAVTLEEYVTAVEQQRDALAEALRQIIQWADPGPQPTYSDNMRDIEAAWAALASLGK